MVRFSRPDRDRVGTRRWGGGIVRDEMSRYEQARGGYGSVGANAWKVVRAQVAQDAGIVWRGSVSIAVEFVCPLPTLTHKQFRGDDPVHHHDDFLRRVVLGAVRLIRIFMMLLYHCKLY